MKNLFYLLIISTLISSCDKIEPPYKEETETNNPDTTQYFSKVLLEDYTGHTCGNCPGAARKGQELKDLYGDRLIIMAVHAGFFSIPVPPASLPAGAPPGSYFYDFRNTVSTELDNYFGISNAGNPNGMINRKEINGNIVAGVNAWGGAVSNALAETPTFGIKITNEFNSGNNSVNINAEVKTLKAISEAYKIVLYLLEDSIQTWQLDYEATPSTHIPDYMHRHVLRDAVNGTWGDSFQPAPSGATITLNYNYQINTAWNAEKCAVVACIYKESSREVVQVEEAHIE